MIKFQKCMIFQMVLLFNHRVIRLDLGGNFLVLVETIYYSAMAYSKLLVLVNVSIH